MLEPRPTLSKSQSLYYPAGSLKAEQASFGTAVVVGLTTDLSQLSVVSGPRNQTPEPSHVVSGEVFFIAQCPQPITMDTGPARAHPKNRLERVPVGP